MTTLPYADPPGRRDYPDCLDSPAGTIRIFRTSEKKACGAGRNERWSRARDASATGAHTARKASVNPSISRRYRLPEVRGWWPGGCHATGGAVQAVLWGALAVIASPLVAQNPVESPRRVRVDSHASAALQESAPSDALFRPVPLPQASSSKDAQPPSPLESVPPPGEDVRWTLESAWQQAMVADSRLRAADATFEAARHGTAAAQAEGRPLVKLNAAYELRTDELAYQILPPITPIPVTQPFMQREFFDFGAQVRVPLYTGGRVAHGVEAAAHGEVSAEAQRETRWLDLRYRVAEEYVAVLRARDEQTVALTYRDNLAAHLHDVDALYREGKAPKNDLLAAQVALSDARHSLVVARHELDAAIAAFNRRLGRPLDAPVSLEPLKYRPENVDLEELTRRALATRPELADLAARATALCHRSEQARAARKPQIYAEGVYGFRENRYQDPQGIAAVRVGADWTMADFGRAEHQAEELAWKSQAVQHQFDHLASTIRLQVRRAWLHLDETRRRLEVAEAALEQADENVRVTRSRYRNGLATNTDVLKAELLRVRTYRNYNHSLYDAILAMMWLKRVTATWEEPAP